MEHIQRPLLEITYAERNIDGIKPGSTVPVQYVVDYYEEVNTYWNAVKIIFITFHVLVALIIGLRCYFFVKANPPAAMEGKFGQVFAAKLVFYIADVWSGIMFWIAFFTNMYWFCMYKL